MKRLRSNILRGYFLILFLNISFSISAQDTLLVKRYIDSARTEFAKNPKESIRFSRKALNLALHVNNQKFIAKAYNTVGSSWYFMNFPDSAKACHLKALEIQTEINDLEGIGRSYTNLGSIYSETGLNEKALSNFMKAEPYFIKIDYKLGLAKLYNSMGILFYNIRDLQSAEKYFTNGLKIAEELKDEVLYSSLSTNLANALSYYGKNAEAIRLYKAGYDIAKRLQNYSNIVTISNSMTEQYLSMKDIANASKYNEEALEMIRKNNLSDYFKISAFGHHAFILSYSGNYKDAIRYYDSAITIAKQAQDLTKEIELYKQLSQSLMLNKDYQKAHAILDYANSLKDSLYLKNLGDKISEINAVHNVEKKEQEITLLNKQKAEQKKRSLLWVIIACVSLVSLGIAIYSYVRKRRDNELIQLQKRRVEKQNVIIADKQKEIIDSINYAKKIQFALLAQERFLQSHLKDYFILFKPKDIVSGDFYWATTVGDLEARREELKNDPTILPLVSGLKTPNRKLFYLAVCDSTGHGVPGAFMSLLNINFLNEAINDKGIHEPSEIFNHVRDRLIENVSQDGQQDGMDGILIRIDENKEEIIYTAANNNPVLVSGNEIIELPADKMPVGKGERQGSFTVQKLNYKKGDILYLYTDGYADQFGGTKEKKFKYKQLNELLLQVSVFPMEQQKETLIKRFDEWKGHLEQVDDVCIIGVRL